MVRMTINPSDFGLRLAEAMVKSKITQSQLADLIGITQGMVSEYLSGKSFPRYNKLLKIADVLKITVAELTGEASPTERPSHQYGIKIRLDNGCNERLYGTTWYRVILRKALNACHIEYRPVHSFRHTFAAQLVMSGVDIFTVKELLGHSDIKMTTIYLHFSADHAKDAIKKLPY